MSSPTTKALQKYDTENDKRPRRIKTHQIGLEDLANKKAFGRLFRAKLYIHTTICTGTPSSQAAQPTAQNAQRHRQKF
jgi:hypothetical protein